MQRLGTRRAAGATGALLLWMSLLLVMGAPALGQQGNPPSEECASALWNGDYWKIQIDEGGLGQIETNVGDGAIDFDLDTTGDPWVVTWENNHSDDVFRIVRKAGQTDSANIEGLWPTGDGGTFTVPDDISHVTFCFTEPEDEETTTTTVDETTTTTEEETTTTAEATTTSATVGGIVVTQPSNPQVSQTTASTLPFTGMSTGSVAVIGAGLAGLGALLLVASRKGEDKAAVRSWS